MKKDELKRELLFVQEIYGRERFNITVAGAEAWLECLEDLEAKAAHEAFVRLVRKSDYPPTVASVRKEYEAIMSERRRRYVDLQNKFSRVCSIYPGKQDTDEVGKAFFNIVYTKDSHSDRMKVADVLYREVDRYVKRCEENDAMENMVPLEEFLVTVSCL